MTAPEQVWIHHADQIKIDGTSCLVFLTPAPANFTGTQSRYARFDLLTAALAERDDAMALFHAADKVLRSVKSERDAAVKRAEKADEAIEVAASIFDTPIGRRRLGLDPNSDESLIEFRALRAALPEAKGE